MKSLLSFGLVFVLSVMHVTIAQAVETPLRLWPGDAPGLPEGVGPEEVVAGGRVSNVSVPMLDVYLPAKDKANGTAIIIVSGGGYGLLASGPLGQKGLKAFGDQGYAVFSLKYRTRSASKDILRDAVADGRRAMRIVRSHAEEWGIKPDRIGMVGFSAGSNLILNLATTDTAGDPSAADQIEQVSGRPDFIGLLATWNYNQKITAFTIDAQVPPLFILHAADDTTAKLAFTEEIVAGWRAAGVPVEYHEWEKGGHMAFNGFRQWPEQLVEWLSRGMIPVVAE